MEKARIHPLHREFDILKNQLTKVNSMLEPEGFNWNLLESQLGQLKAECRKLADENAAAEQKIKESLEAAGQIIRNAEERERQIKSNATVLFHSAQQKYKQLEERLNIAERKSIQKHLKELEEVVA